tara:strand:- start:455 stop:1003 length:549 start_codon:yes stop_codon:yes gene_type:complete
MIIKKIFSDVSYIEPEIYKDDRGSFSEIFNEELFKKNNLKINYIQDNFSFSELKNTIRGLHFQKKPFEQTKLIKVINGSIFDVFVDLREDSNDFGSYSSIELTQDMGWVLIPKGFAHGFKTLEDNTSVLYKVDQYYNPENDSGIIWNDNFLNIDWNLSSDPVLSEKDKNLSNWDAITTGLKD